MKKLILVVLIGFALTGCRRHQVEPKSAMMVEVSDVMIVDETNANRQQKGLTPLVINEELMKAAKLQAHNMASRSELSHELDIDGQSTLTDRLRFVGYHYQNAGENIAWNYSSNTVVEGWMNSAGHRRNILGNFTEIGVGVATNEAGEPYYCQVFGSR